jgi:hypothetical protein
MSHVVLTLGLRLGEWFALPKATGQRHGKVESTMNWIPVIWSIWGASVVLMAVVSVYASRLGKNEEDQLFLSDSSSHEQSEQAAISLRLQKVQPLKKMALAILGATTLIVVAYYLFDVVRQFK